MTRPETRARIADNLDWLRTTGPDHIVAIATEQHEADQAAPRPTKPAGTNAAAPSAPSSSGLHLGHADPTANTATTTRTRPAVVDFIDRNLVSIHAQARNLDHTTAHALHHDPTSIVYEPDRYGLVSNALTYLPLGHQLDDAAAKLHGADLHHLDWLIRDLDERTIVLVARATTILEASPHAAAAPAIQKTVIGCISHARFTELSGRQRFEMVDPEYRDLCTDCGRFRKRERILPSKEIIDAWDHNRHPTRLMIEAARTESKRKTKPRLKTS